MNMKNYVSKRDQDQVRLMIRAAMMHAQSSLSNRSLIVVRDVNECGTVSRLVRETVGNHVVNKDEAHDVRTRIEVIRQDDDRAWMVDWSRATYLGSMGGGGRMVYVDRRVLADVGIVLDDDCGGDGDAPVDDDDHDVEVGDDEDSVEAERRRDNEKREEEEEEHE